MNEASTIAARHWVATPQEAQQWGIQQWETAKAQNRMTQGYFPRYKHRHVGLDGSPMERHVKVASSLVIPPSAVVHSVMRQAQRALRPVLGSDKVRFLDRSIVHLTHHAIYPGANEAEDEAKVAIAREVAPKIDLVARHFRPMVLTMDGLTITDRQLMVTYRGDDGWNSFLDSAADLEQQIPEFWNAYDLKRSPLEEGGRALNTTVAVFDEGIDMKILADAIEPYLPGNNAFQPTAFVAQNLKLMLQEFDEEYVQRFTETLARTTFRGAPSPRLEPGQIGRAPFCGLNAPEPDFGRC